MKLLAHAFKYYNTYIREKIKCKQIMKKSKVVLFLCVLLFAIFITPQVEACVSRKDVYDCIIKRGDRNKDKQISRKEMKAVEDKYISWWVRIPYNVFGGSNQVYNDCDTDKNNQITLEEMTTVKSCLETCDKREKVFSTLQC